jgi:hypothetical protein
MRPELLPFPLILLAVNIVFDNPHNICIPIFTTHVEWIRHYFFAISDGRVRDTKRKMTILTTSL